MRADVLPGRRDLLTLRLGRTAGSPAGRALDPFDPLDQSSGQTGVGEGHWLRVFRGAMACRFEVTLSGEDLPLIAVAREALIEADRLEAALSVFRESSDLTRVNRTAAAAPAPVDAELFTLLRRCQALHAATEGAFDITSTPLSRCWGFLRRDGRVPDAEALATARACAGMDLLQLQDESPPPLRLSPAPPPSPPPTPTPSASSSSSPLQSQSLSPASPASSSSQTASRPSPSSMAAPQSEPCVRFARDGVELNLGGIGKGYAVQRIGDRLRRDGVRHALVSAGGSSVLAIGGRDDGWLIHLRGPRELLVRRERHERYERYETDGAGRMVDASSGIDAVGTSNANHANNAIDESDEGDARQAIRIWLRDAALGTSGTGEQFFEADGRRYGHLIDPRTGRPSEAGLLSATVVTADAADADALATAFFVGGPELARRYCARHPGTLAVLIDAADPRRPHVIGHCDGARVQLPLGAAPRRTRSAAIPTAPLAAPQAEPQPGTSSHPSMSHTPHIRQTAPPAAPTPQTSQSLPSSRRLPSLDEPSLSVSPTAQSSQFSTAPQSPGGPHGTARRGAS